jgi:peptide/nickel transport system substrate-binding protein
MRKYIRQQSRGRWVAVAALCPILTLSLSGLSAQSTSAAAAPRPFLIVNGPNGGPYTDDFNPFSPSGQVSNTQGFLYEPLFNFNLLTSQESPAPVAQPWLATGYQWNSNDTQLTLDIRHNVEWSDGVPLTSADVAYTIGIEIQYPALNTSAVDYKSVKADGPYQVTITFAQPSYNDLLFVGQLCVVPEHMFSKAGNIEKFTNPKPIGSGPYLLQSFSTGSVIWKPNPHFWGGAPKVQEIVDPALASNTLDDEYLTDGLTPFAGNYQPNLASWLASDPQYNHYWFPVSGTNPLIANTSVFPTNSLAVREAISDAIDRSLISTAGEYGWETPSFASNMPPAATKALDPAAAVALPYEPAESASILEKAGFKKVGGYFQTASGKRLSVTVDAPGGVTDFIAITQLIADELNQVGIQAAANVVAGPSFGATLNEGRFTLALIYVNPSASEYRIFDQLMNANEIGKYGDYAHWNDPQTQKLLAAYAGANTPSAETVALKGLINIQAKDLPVIPVLNQVLFYQYVDKYWGGFPSASDPYEVPLINNTAPDNEIIMEHIYPKS